MKKVYTSLEGFQSNGCIVESYKNLRPELVEWIDENTSKLIMHRNEAELVAGEVLSKLVPSIEKQVFFRIHGRCYFLDFYYPAGKVAIEIDGGYHDNRKGIDECRDKDFKSIGIDTIRIKDTDVRDGRLLAILNDKARQLNTEKKPKKSKKVKNKYNRRGGVMMKEAMKRVKEHDKMKYKASWI